MTDKLIHGLYREGEKIADAKAPHDVPIAQRWEQRKFTAALVNWARSSGRDSGRRAMMPMLALSPLSPLRPQASRTSGKG